MTHKQRPGAGDTGPESERITVNSSMKSQPEDGHNIRLEGDYIVKIGDRLYPVLLAEIEKLPCSCGPGRCRGDEEFMRRHPDFRGVHFACHRYGSVRVWCRYCKRHHIHGYDPIGGHKVAHCHNRCPRCRDYVSGDEPCHRPGCLGKPYRRGGYFVLMPGVSLKELFRNEREAWEVVSDDSC